MFILKQFISELPAMAILKDVIRAILAEMSPKLAKIFSHCRLSEGHIAQRFSSRSQNPFPSLKQQKQNIWGRGDLRTYLRKLSNCLL